MTGGCFTNLPMTDSSTMYDKVINVRTVNHT